VRLLATGGDLGMIQLPPDRLTPASTIIAATENAYGIPRGGLRWANGKSEPICGARQIAMYLVREHTAWSLTRIGRLFGGFHHTTVLHALRMVEKEKADNPRLCEAMDRIAEDARLLQNAKHPWRRAVA
jgi:chromosomal replication initiator protein